MKKLAVIGCGGIGTYHLDHFVKYDDVELVGFCDLIIERAEEFVKVAGQGRAFTCYKEMLDATVPDMVFVCVPPTEHGDIEFELIKRGIHLFVEKPIALDMGLAKKIRDAIEAAGLISAVGFQLRYDNLAGLAKEYVDGNEIIYVNCARVGGIPGTPWWKVKSLSGGQIVEQTIHQFDMIRYVFDEPDTVFTMGARGFVSGVEGYDTDDVTSTVVKFKSGALATITTGCYADEGDAADSKLTFGGRSGRADLYAASKLELYGAAPASEASDAVSNTFIKGDGGLTQSFDGALTYKNEVDFGTICDRTFVDAVISGDKSKILSPYSDAVKSLAFTLACNESLDKNAPVKVDLD